MIYDDIGKGLRDSFRHIENARNDINLRKDSEQAKAEFKIAYQEIFQLMGLLNKSKNTYPELKSTLDKLKALHDKTLFDTIRKIGIISNTELSAICQLVEGIITKEIIRMDQLKKKNIAA